MLSVQGWIFTDTKYVPVPRGLLLSTLVVGGNIGTGLDATYTSKVVLPKIVMVAPRTGSPISSSPFADHGGGGSRRIKFSVSRPAPVTMPVQKFSCCS